MLLGKHGDYSNQGATEAQQKSMRELKGRTGKERATHWVEGDLVRLLKKFCTEMS